MKKNEIKVLKKQEINDRKWSTKKFIEDKKMKKLIH